MITWVVDELLGERADYGFPSLADAAERLSHTVIRTKYVPFSKTLPTNIHIPEKTCVVAYGTVQFCKQFEYKYGRRNTPSLYFNEKVKHWSRYVVHFDKRDLLNQNYYILPFRHAIGEMRNQSLFIKPESGMKEFTGQVLPAGITELEARRELCPHGGPIDPDTLCVVAYPHKINAEFRYVICERQIVAKSEYRWDNVLDIRTGTDTHPLCDALAQKVAANKWQPDSVYVCDIALIGGKAHLRAKLIELNAFSSSGLYACDTHAIVKAVSAAAWKEHQGEGFD